MTLAFPAPVDAFANMVIEQWEGKVPIFGFVDVWEDFFQRKNPNWAITGLESLLGPKIFCQYPSIHMKGILKGKLDAFKLESKFMGPPKSAWHVQLGKGRNSQSYHLVWSVLFKSAQAAHHAINEWNALYTKATIQAIENIRGHIWILPALPIVLREEMLAMTENVDWLSHSRWSKPVHIQFRTLIETIQSAGA